MPQMIVPILENMNVYALWQERPEHSVMVTFHAYPGSSVQSVFVLQYYGWKMAPSASLPANTVTLPSNMPTRGTGYSNDSKWYKTYNGEEVQFTETSIVTGNISVHPKWVKSDFNLTSLSAKYGAIDADFNTAFDVDTHAYTSILPSFVTSVTVSANYEGPEGTIVEYTPNATITSFTSGSNTVTLTVKYGVLAPKVYTVTFTQKTVAQTQMASGGTTSFVQVNSGDNATWDEGINLQQWVLVVLPLVKPQT
ncbi:MAG: hypothetical protein Ta2B_03140 [Termitinemataceae bacterium]|nr:MAG: hypothetical protein Ta2B_03140 [Termitinemataceae bacterium]